MTVSDVHTHIPFRRESICSGTPEQVERWLSQKEEGLFSVGIHPWDTKVLDARSLDCQIAQMHQLLLDPRVVAVGECGIDKLRGASPEWQKEVFFRQAMLAEELEKPLVLHVVRASEEVIQSYKQIAKEKGAPLRQPWIWHGFRGNERVSARIMLSLPNQYISFGEHFNDKAANSVPSDRLLVETDQSSLAIGEIENRLALALKIPIHSLVAQLRSNAARIFS